MKGHHQAQRRRPSLRRRRARSSTPAPAPASGSPAPQRARATCPSRRRRHPPLPSARRIPSAPRLSSAAAARADSVASANIAIARSVASDVCHWHAAAPAPAVHLCRLPAAASTTALPCSPTRRPPPRAQPRPTSRRLLRLVRHARVPEAHRGRPDLEGHDRAHQVHVLGARHHQEGPAQRHRPHARLV
ncbi:hypothetical protein DAI22_05g151300 [Oryza sativa Japonica Group]|nr:hypothetical protein DAI22_05g151300 [Oryza sativa Japonica Group]